MAPFLWLALVWASGSPEGYHVFPVREQGGQPSLALDGTPQMEAWKKGLHGWIKISGSERALKRLEVLEPYRGVAEAWRPRSVHARLSNQEVVEALNALSTNRDVFRQSLAGSTATKVKLLEDLLFSRQLRLTRETLRDLKRSFDRPSPAPIEVKIPVSMGTHIGWDLWNVVTDSWIRVQVDSLEFEFKEKKIEFDPRTQIFRVSLETESADLRGPVEEIGEVSFFSQYFNTRYWVQSSYLERGRVSALRIQAGIRLLWDDVEHLWRLDLAEPLQLVVPEGVQPMVDLRMRRTMKTPQHQMVEEVVEKPVPLTKSAQDEVERTLSDTVREAFQTSFIRKSMGVEVPFFQNPQVETQLGNIAILDSGLEISFDSRVRWQERGDFCLTPQRRADRVQPRVSAVREDGRPWQILSVFSNGDESSRWRLLSKPGERSVQIEAEADLFDTLVRAALSQPDGCLKGEQLLRRRMYVPKQVLAPRAPGEWRFQDGRMELFLEGVWTGFDRTQSFLNEDFQERESHRVKLSLALTSDPLKREVLIALGPEATWNDISLSESLQQWNSLFHSFLSREIEGLGLRWAEGGRPGVSFDWDFFKLGVSEVRIADSGLSLQISNLAWADLFQKRPSTKPIVQAQALSPPRTENLRMTRAQGGVSFEWDGSQFYSWRLRSPDDPNPRWSEFAPHSWVILPVKPERRYEFQVKAMNEAYQIEKTPLVLEFFVPKFTSTPTPKKDEALAPSSPSAEPEIPKASEHKVHRASSKGFFGCGVVAGNESPSPMVWVLVLFALLILRRSLPYRK